MTKMIWVCFVFFVTVESAGPRPFILNDLGCWIDKPIRAVAVLEGESEHLDGEYSTREDAIQKCAHAAYDKNYDVMCVQHGGACISSHAARQNYFTYGKSTACAADGKGGAWANHCYEINTVWTPKYTPVGCYKDAFIRAMPSLEGTSAQLNGNAATRSDAVRKCARLVASKHTAQHAHWYFGIQYGGQCFSGFHYNKHGVSTACAGTGKGGAWANSVYRITGHNKFKFVSVGCYQDKVSRAIQPAENNNLELTGNYALREDAIGKCARHAKEMGFSHFALQNGGWCATNINALATYSKYGVSAACAADGKGGPWASQVYKIL